MNFANKFFKNPLFHRSGNVYELFSPAKFRNCNLQVYVLRSAFETSFLLNFLPLFSAVVDICALYPTTMCFPEEFHSSAILLPSTTHPLAQSHTMQLLVSVSSAVSLIETGRNAIVSCRTLFLSAQTFLRS